MQYILSETEYQAFLALKEENAKLSHKLAVANEVREKDRDQINNLYGLVAQGKQSIKERDQRIADLKHARDLDNKALAEKAHEILVLNAELANFSSKWREAERDMEGTSRRLKAAEMLSKSRLQSMNNLMKKVRRLKSEHVCVAQNRKTGTVKVISVVKADTYRKFGWAVSEEYLVDRPTDCEPFDWSGTPGI